MQRLKGVPFDLKSEREKRRLSQTAIAEILCSTQASVSRWESSGMMPNVHRKLWELHWKLEGRANDKGTNRGFGKAKRSARSKNKGAEGTSRRGARVRLRTESGGEVVPKSGNV